MIRMAGVFLRSKNAQTKFGRSKMHKLNLDEVVTACQAEREAWHEVARAWEDLSKAKSSKAIYDRALAIYEQALAKHERAISSSVTEVTVTASMLAANRRLQKLVNDEVIRLEKRISRLSTYSFNLSQEICKAKEALQVAKSAQDLFLGRLPIRDYIVSARDLLEELWETANELDGKY